MPENEYKYLDHAGLTRFKGKIQDILDTKVDKETGKYLVTVDSALSTTSTNPVQNKVVASKLGSTDISSIGDGSVTGAISSLNTDKLSIRPAGSTLLTSGQNLNSLGIGNYYSNSNSLTQSLVNAPAGLDTAIRLFVMDIGYSGIPYGIQIIVYNSGMYWRRCLNSDGSSWSAWVKFVDPNADIAKINAGSVWALGTDIPANGDFNNYTTPGMYNASAAGSIAHTPSTSVASIQLMVIKRATTASRVTQVAYAYFSTYTTIYIRSMTGESTWTDWVQMAKQSDVDKLNTDITTPTLVDDCNNATDPRVVYYAKSTSSNRPDTTRYPSVWWFLRPFAKYGTNDLFQIATPISTSAEGSVVYTRSKVSGTGWSTWRRVIIETDLNLTRVTYTPTITVEASSSTATFDNMSFTYFKQAGSFLVVSGRFRVAEAGSVDTYIRISLPSGFKTLDNGVGNLGVVTTSPYNGNWFELRTADNGTYMRLVRSGGNTSLPSLLTNTYVTIFAFVPLKP